MTRATRLTIVTMSILLACDVGASSSPVLTRARGPEASGTLLSDSSLDVGR